MYQQGLSSWLAVGLGKAPGAARLISKALVWGCRLQSSQPHSGRTDLHPSALCCGTPRPRADTEHSGTWTPGRKWPPGEKSPMGSSAQLCRESRPDVGMSTGRWGLRFHRRCSRRSLVPGPSGARPPARGRPTRLRRHNSFQAQPLSAPARHGRAPQAAGSFPPAPPALPGSSGSRTTRTLTSFQAETSHRRLLHKTPLPTSRSGCGLRASQAAPDPPLPLPAGGHFRPATAELAEDQGRKWPNLRLPGREECRGVRDFPEAPGGGGGGGGGGLCPPGS